MKGVFLQQFAPPYALANLVYFILSLVLTAAGRFVLKAMGYPPKKELLYWVSGTVSIFLGLACLSVLLSFSSKQQLSLLSESKRAAFEPSLEFIIIGEVRDAKGVKVPCALMLASITNKGEPSILSGIWLTAKLPGESPVPGEAHTLPPETTVTYLDGSREVISATDALNLKAGEHPIPTGGSTRGWMLYAFPQMSLDSPKAVGTVYELTVVDVWHRQYKATLKNSGAPAAVMNFPGIRPRIIEPRKPSVSGVQR